MSERIRHTPDHLERCAERVGSPTVSVVLNCYNHEPYVGEAIESVLSQTFRDFELILIDNGSTDGSRRVMQSYDDNRIRLILHDSNGSIARRLNEGVAAARGEFVAVLYSDDIFLPNKLERQVGIFDELSDEYGLVYSPTVKFNQFTGERWQEPIMAVSGDMMPGILDHYYDGAVQMGAPLARRQCYIQYPFYDDLFADGEMIFFRFALGWRFHFDPEPTVAMRDHDANIGKAVQKNHDMMMEMWDRVAQHPDFRQQYLPNLRRLQARACTNDAWIALRMNSTDNQWLRRQFVRAVRTERSEATRPRFLAGLALASLPPRVRLGLNRAFNMFRSHRENTNIVVDYSTPSEDCLY